MGYAVYIDRLVEAKDVVFECGPKCGCGPGCVNRTSQKGIRYRLEVAYFIGFHIFGLSMKNILVL